MELTKILSLLFLAIYLILTGLSQLGIMLSLISSGLVGFFALGAGILLLIRGIKWCSVHHCCGSKCSHDKDKI